MTPLQEKRLAKLKSDLERFNRTADNAVATLCALTIKIQKTKRKIARYGQQQKIATPAVAKVVTPEVKAPVFSDADLQRLDIPDFLQRSPAALPPDKYKEALETEAKLEEQKEQNKKTRALVRKEVKEAKLRGQLKKIPLSGKAALDFIKNG